MDGRACSFLALALSLGLCGCLPSQMKTTTVESQPLPPVDKADGEEAKSLNPFASKPKREPRLELAMGIYREQKALSMKEDPEKQAQALDDARKIYQEILNYDNKYLEAYRGLGRVYIAQRDYDRAVATYQKALELHPKTAQLYADWSVVHSKQNDFNGAITKLNKAVELDPQNAEILKTLGVNQVCAGQVEQGIETLSRGRNKETAHYYVARLFDRKNQAAEARRHAQRAVEINPDYGDARTFLVELDRRNQVPSTVPLPSTLPLASNLPPSVSLQFAEN
jgi:tetratricopeptide (TPR) repeat protein